MNLVQPPWNFVEEFGIAGNPNKGHSVSSQLDQTELWQCRHIPSLFASLSHGRYSRSRARVALGREVQLPMSFPWPVFPGLDQDLFPPWFSSFFGIRFQNGAKDTKDTMKKKKQKGNSNDLSILIRYFSRFSLQPPFIEVLSGLLRAAYWPLVF